MININYIILLVLELIMASLYLLYNLPFDITTLILNYYKLLYN